MIPDHDNAEMEHVIWIAKFGLMRNASLAFRRASPTTIAVAGRAHAWAGGAMKIQTVIAL